MGMMRRPTWLVLFIGALLGVLSGEVASQRYPSKPVRMIVPFPPGGINDLVARIVAERLAQALNQSVVVENHGGAGGVIGTDLVAKAPPDGYTLLEGSAGALAMGLKLFSNVPYDVMRDFAFISMLADASTVLVINPSTPFKSVKELVAAAKAQPRKITGGIPGLVTPPHLLTELFKLRTGADLNLVPYKGGGPATMDLIAGHIDVMFIGAPSVVEFIKSGRLKALAVANDKRSNLLPEVPTMAESGFPGMTATPWTVLAAPAGTPAPIIDQLNAEVAKMMATAGVKEYLAKNGANPLSTTPAETRAFIRSEIKKWGDVVTEAHLKLE